MTKLNFNYTSISTSIIPNLDDTISGLEQLGQKNDTMFIPKDFYYYSYLKEYKEQIRLIKGSYKDKRGYLVESNRNLDITLEKIDNNLLSIKQAEIKYRSDLL